MRWIFGWTETRGSISSGA